MPTNKKTMNFDLSDVAGQYFFSPNFLDRDASTVEELIKYSVMSG